MKTRFAAQSALLMLSLAAVFSTGCMMPRVRQPMHAIWVTRYDYKTADDVKKIVADCADGGFNTILFQVRGNGTVFYESEIEPWAEQFDFQHPGFDPLELACVEAHRHGVDLHAWVNVMPAWDGPEPPDNPYQLYHTHPEWFWYDQYGKRQGLSSFYVSLNPCLPEVREYLVSVFEEIVANYDVDGLHMDYIRFPNEPPATPRGSDIDYPRDERTLELYKAATGLAPDDNKARWNRWRTEQVTQLVVDIQAMMRRVNPGAVLSAAIGSIPERSLHHFRDGEYWIEHGLIDCAMLMNYTDSPKTFGERIDPWLKIDTDVPIVPGLWFGRHRGKPIEEATEAVAEQIRIALEKTGNVCVFAYSSMFSSADKGELTKATKAEQRKREIRRSMLLPITRGK